jgi:Fe-S-cluster containining protein
MIPATVAQWLQGIEKERGVEASERAALMFMKAADHYKRELLKTPDVSARVLTAHDGADQIMEHHLKTQSLEKKITCRRGCAECCRMFVAVTPSEAKLMLRTIKARNIEVDWEKLSRQAGKKEDDFYNDVMGDDNKCVFLDDKSSCKIYKLRPMSCRNHLVASPKELCSMESSNKVKKVFSPEVEALTFAYLDLEGLENLSMADGLLRYRKEEGL